MVASRELLARRVRDAVAGAGLSQRQLATAVDMDPTVLNRALGGRRGFRALELASIADRLGLSTDALLADETGDGPPAGRPGWNGEVVAGSGPAGEATGQPRGDDEVPAEPDLPASVRAALRRVEQLLDIDVALGEFGFPAVSQGLPGLPSLPDPMLQGQALAEAVRWRTRLGDGDLPAELTSFARWIEQQLGVDVCLAPLGAGFDGLAVSRGSLRLALVSSSATATRQRFTLAHLLCHLAVGDEQLTVDRDVSDRSSAAEQRANAFAAAFLMPPAAVRAAAAGKRIDDNLVAELLGRFRVSLHALAFRLHHVGLVNANGRELIRDMSSSRIVLRPGRIEDLQARDEIRAPGRLLTRAVEAYAAGAWGVEPVAALLQTDPDRLRDELSPPGRAAYSGDPDEWMSAL